MIQKNLIKVYFSLLTCGLMVFAINGQAQLRKVDTWEYIYVKESKVLKETDKRYDQVVYLEPFFYTLNNKNMKHSIEKYDADMNWVAEESFKRSEFLLGAELKVLNGELYYVDSENNYKKKTSTISFLKINKETLLPEGEPFLLVNEKFDNKDHFRTSNYDFVIDDELNLIGVLTYAKQENSEYVFELRIYNERFELVNTLHAEIPGIDRRALIYYLRLASADQVVFAYTKPQEVNGKTNYVYGVASVSQNGFDFMHDLKGEYNLVYPKNIELSSEGDLIIIEHYRDDPEGQYSGVYYLKLDGESGEVLYQTITNFSKEFYKYAETEKQRERVDESLAKGEFPIYYGIGQEAYLQFDDNSTLVIHNHVASSESYVVGSRNQFGTQTTFSSSSEYNIHLWYFNWEGKLLWTTKIPRAVEGGWYQNGFYAFDYNDEAYVLFMDAPENIRSFGDETATYLEDIRNAKFISMVKVNKDGTLERKALYQPDEDDLSARITLANQFQEGKIALPMKTKNRRQLKLIELDF